MACVETAVRYLERQRLRYIDMLENLRFEGSRLVAAGDAGVLLQGPSGVWMLAAQDAEAALELCAGIDKVETMVIHQRECEDALCARFGLMVNIRCVQVAYMTGTPMAMPENGVQVRPLEDSWLDFVMEHYKAKVGRDYMAGRFAAGVMVGAFAGGELAGFAGEHGEGTLGMLEVLPAWRRRGVGRALAAYTVNRCLAQGRVPHAQVELNNEVSLAMQRRLGFEVGSDVLCWLEAPWE